METTKTNEEKIDYIYKSLLKFQSCGDLYNYEYTKDHEEYILENNNVKIILKYIEHCAEADIDKCFEYIKKSEAGDIIYFYNLCPDFSKDKIKNAILYDSYNRSIYNLHWLFINLKNISIIELEDYIIKHNLSIVKFACNFKEYGINVQKLRNAIVQNTINNKDKIINDFDNMFF